MQYIIKQADGRRWAVKSAVSLGAAMNAIAHARVSGSVGHKDMRTTYIAGKDIDEWPVTVIADVHQLNSDGTERQPYTEAY